MRVIGGVARGRRLVAPELASVRPTSDRAREAIFDVLSHLDAVRGAAVLDLFAGSGALGIEALSRGAASVTFVDSDRRVSEVIRANLASARLGAGRADPSEEVGSSSIHTSEALAFCRAASRRFDLALCDPPYAFAAWAELLAVIPARLVVLESSRPIELTEAFDLHREYRYGTTLVAVAHRREVLDESSNGSAGEQVST